MADAGLLSVKITADDSQLTAALARASVAVKKTGDEIRSGINDFAKYGAAAIAAGAIIAGSFVSSQLEAIDTQAKLARQTGGTTTAIQTLARASDLAGVSTETLTKAAGGLNVKLGQAMEGTGTAVGALHALGLTAKELSKLDTDQRMALIADRINDAGISAQQTAAIMRDLGIKQAEVISLFEGGGDAIRQARADVVGFGVAVSEIDAAKIEAGNDALTSIKFTLQGIATQAAIAVAPLLQEIGTRFGDASKEAGGFRNVVIPALEAVAKGAGFVGDALRGIEVVWKMLSSGALYLKADVLTAYEAMATGAAKIIDFQIKQVNLLIAGLNMIPNVEIQPIKLASQSDTIKGIHDVAQAARDEARSADSALEDLAMAPMPTKQIEGFFDAVKKRSQEAAEQVVAARKSIADTIVIDTTDPKEKQKKHDEGADSIQKIKAGALSGNDKALAELQEKYTELNKIIAKNPELQQQAAEAAGLLAKQYQDGVDAQIAAGNRANDAFLEQMSDRVKIIQHQNDTEIEISTQKFKDDQEALEEALLNRVITEQEYNDLSLQQQSAHEKNMSDMKLKSWKDLEKLSGQSWKVQTAIVAGSLADMTAQMATKNRTFFEINKVAAAANAAVRIPSMMAGAFDAMVGIPYVGPVLAVAAAAAAGAFGAAQVQSILSTSYGSGAKSTSAGIPSAATSAPTGTGAPAGPSQSQTLAVQGLDSGSLFDGKTVRALAEKLIDFQRDGGKVVFTA